MAVIAGPHSECDDRDLVAFVRAGDDSAFEELYRRYSRRVAGYVHRMVGDHDRAEDVTQEAFFSALRRLRQTETEIAFKPWIFEIAKNGAIDHFRRTSRAEEVSIDPEDGALRPADHLRLVNGGPSPDLAFVHKERLGHLQGAFDELSDSHSRILVMRELEGLSYREIGERMELTRPAVESTLFRARRRLGQEYAELDTGARCLAMTAAVARLAEGIESSRDRRRLERHVHRCSSCRRHARELGVEVEPRGTLPARVAALLPVPALLRRRREGGAEGGAGSGSAGHGYAAGVQQAAGTWAPTMASAGGEAGAAAWGKAAALVAAVALAGGGSAVQQAVVGGEPGAGSSAAAADAEGSQPRVAGLAAGGELQTFLSPRGTEIPAPAGHAPGGTAFAGAGDSPSSRADGGATGGGNTPGGASEPDRGESFQPPSVNQPAREDLPLPALPERDLPGADDGGSADGGAGRNPEEGGDSGGDGDGSGDLPVRPPAPPRTSVPPVGPPPSASEPPPGADRNIPAPPEPPPAPSAPAAPGGPVAGAAPSLP